LTKIAVISGSTEFRATAESCEILVQMLLLIFLYDMLFNPEGALENESDEERCNNTLDSTCTMLPHYFRGDRSSTSTANARS
jgi:hypothetical protein